MKHISKHSLEDEVLHQVRNGPPGLSSLQPVPPADTRNKPTSSVCLQKVVSREAALPFLSVDGALHITALDRWDWLEQMSFHMPHLGSFVFS